MKNLGDTEETESMVPAPHWLTTEEKGQWMHLLVKEWMIYNFFLNDEDPRWKFYMNSEERVFCVEWIDKERVVFELGCEGWMWRTEQKLQAMSS